MTQLVTLLAYQERFNLPDDDVLNAKLSASIDAATIYVSEFLRNPSFDAVTAKVDVFQPPLEGTEMYNREKWVFLLSQGLVDAASVEIRIAQNREDLAESDPVDSTYVFVNSDRGVVTLMQKFWETYSANAQTNPYLRTCARPYVSITFDAGMTEASNVYQDVPAWLAEAAMMKAQEIQTCGTKSSGGGDGTIKAQLSMLVGSKIRYVPYAVKSL